MLDLQLRDNQKARFIRYEKVNAYKKNDEPALKSQIAIYQHFVEKSKVKS